MNQSLSPRELLALKKEILSSLHCALPGIVESFDAAAGTACIRPALTKMPVLQDVPVFVCSEVNPGDLCLVVFADCDADAFLETGGPASRCREECIRFQTRLRLWVSDEGRWNRDFTASG